MHTGLKNTHINIFGISESKLRMRLPQPPTAFEEAEEADKAEAA